MLLEKVLAEFTGIREPVETRKRRDASGGKSERDVLRGSIRPFSKNAPISPGLFQPGFQESIGILQDTKCKQLDQRGHVQVV
jgi:hypothetical protein